MVRLTFDLAVQVLHEHRHTGERTVARRLRLGARPLESRVDHCVELRIHALHGGNREIDEFGGGELFAAQQFCLRRGIKFERVGHVPTH